MDFKRGVISLLIVLEFISVVSSSPAVYFDTSLLCTEQYRMQLVWDEGLGTKIDFNDGTTRFVEVFPTSASGSHSFYFIPKAGVTYYANIRDNVTGTYYQSRQWSTNSICTGLRSTGLDPRKQVVLITDVLRQDSGLPASAGIFWNSNLQDAAQEAVESNQACSTFLTTQSLATYNITYIDPPACWDIQSSTADAGALVYFMKDIIVNWFDGVYWEIGVGQNVVGRRWMIFVIKRTNACGNRYKHSIEDCDDGNKVNGDGCNSRCELESGWTCTTDVLQEGSLCVQSPAAPMATPTVTPTAPSTPTAIPVAISPISTPSVTPTATSPTSAPSASPTAVTPNSVTPISTPVVSPTSIAPTARPNGSPTSVTPSASPSIVPASSPSSSPSAVSPATPNGTPSNSPTTTSPSSTPGSIPYAGPFSDSPISSPPGSQPSATPTATAPRADRGTVSNSRKITASLVIVTMLSVLIALF